MVEQLRRRWPEDWTKLHVYFCPDPVEIAPLVDAYRSVLDGVDFLSPQPDEWLHATVMVVDGVPAREVSERQRADLEHHLRQAVSEIPAFTLTCGPATAGRSSIALDLVPDRDFLRLVDRVKVAAGAVFGPEAVRYSNGRPHITLGYARGDGDSGIIQTALRNATDLRVTLTVDTVRLVDVLVDTERVQFRWQELAVLPLQR
ncbi:2'-5' RNA ligase family protein [Nocardia terpenica]|nr:2'-5' RNA ligase family protein [Nocardia terpenica]